MMLLKLFQAGYYLLELQRTDLIIVILCINFKIISHVIERELL